MGCASSLSAAVSKSEARQAGTLNENRVLDITVLPNYSDKNLAKATGSKLDGKGKMENSVMEENISEMKEEKPKAVLNPHSDLFTRPEEEVKSEINERLAHLISLGTVSSEACYDDLQFLMACSKVVNQEESKKKKNMYCDEMAARNIGFLIKNSLVQVPVDMAITNETVYRNMKALLVVNWNGTDASVALCEHIVATDTHKDIIEYMNNPLLFENESENQHALYLSKALFGILHNILQNCDVRENFRACKAVEIFDKFRKSKNLMLKCKAEFNLCHIVNEEENALLNAHAENIKFMGKILTATLENEKHYSRKYGYRTQEVIACVNKMAVNDENKMKLVQEGFLKHYTSLLDPNTNEEIEQYLAAKGLWTLAFKVGEQIKEEPGCVKGLTQLSEHGVSERVVTTAKGALWVLGFKERASETRRSKVKIPHGEAQELEENEEDDGSDQSHVSKTKGHVMISYQWDKKPIMLRMRDALQRSGYAVWMDVDHMSGSILDAMAKAVENASIVIICLSQKYKESPNCRTEAEYAYRCNKPIIPLLLQHRYRADGWLGAIAGNRLYFDISVETKYDTSLTNFLTEIGRLSGNDTIKPKKEQLTSASPPTAQGESKSVTWSANQVSDWLRKNGLEKQVKRFDGMDGSLVIELKTMFSQAPEFFYSTLRDQMHLSLLDILRFTKALKAL